MIVAGWRRWFGFRFVHGGKRETGEEGRENKLERGDYFFGYIF